MFVRENPDRKKNTTESEFTSDCDEFEAKPKNEKKIIMYITHLLIPYKLHYWVQCLL